MAHEVRLLRKAGDIPDDGLHVERARKQAKWLLRRPGQRRYGLVVRVHYLLLRQAVRGIEQRYLVSGAGGQP